jgi:hypothetical protein
MDERFAVDERLERDLRAGLAALLDPVVESHPSWEASPAAEQALAGGRRGPAGRLGVLWVAGVAALVLVALLAAAAFVGGWRPDLSFVNPPAPTPLPALTVVDEGTDVLATTRARPLPAQATCPPGSDPDALGPTRQARPTSLEGAAMAFDRHAGRIVVLTSDGDRTGRGSGTQTWTYDVCTNAWQRMRPFEVDWQLRQTRFLVYDADSDRTLAFVELLQTPTTPVEIWSYELAADEWTHAGLLEWPWPEVNATYGTALYHDPSGLVVFYDGAEMWAYDVDTNALAKVRQQPDPAVADGSGLPAGKVALGYDAGHDLVVAVVAPYDGDPDVAAYGEPPNRWRVPLGEWAETWTFDPRTGRWHLEAAPAPADLIVCGGFGKGSTECYPTPGRAVFDEASSLAVFISRDFGRPAAPGRVDAYDAAAGAWRTLHPATGSGGDGPSWCSSMPPVYDSLNRRIVCGQGLGVTAFSTATGQWRWLLEDGIASCDIATLAGAPGRAGAADGAGPDARFAEPHSIVVGADGALYVSDTANHAIRRMTPDGVVTTFAGRLGVAGSADGSGSDARLSRPNGLAIDAAGVVVVADTGNDAIRRITPDGIVSTLADGLGIAPVAVAVDDSGTVYAAGSTDSPIVEIAPDGTVTTLPSPSVNATDLAVAEGGLFVVDLASDGEQSRIRFVTRDGAMTEVGYDWENLGRPGATFVDTTGILYVTSTLDGSVVEVPGGPWQVIAGLPGWLGEVGTPGYRGMAGHRDGPGRSALFNRPTDLARDAAGLFYVVDSGNSVIRTMSCTP